MIKTIRAFLITSLLINSIFIPGKVYASSANFGNPWSITSPTGDLIFSGSPGSASNTISKNCTPYTLTIRTINGQSLSKVISENNSYSSQPGLIPYLQIIALNEFNVKILLNVNVNKNTFSHTFSICPDYRGFNEQRDGSKFFLSYFGGAGQDTSRYSVYYLLPPKPTPEPQQTSNPAPQQTTNPTPQQNTNPTPQQNTNPTPQQNTNPTPQQTSNPAPEIVIQNRVIQSEWGVPMELVNTSVKGKMITIFTGESRLALYELKELKDYNAGQYGSLRKSLISKSKKSKQTECGSYEILGNVFGDKLVNTDCFIYEPVSLNLITGQVTERTLRIDSPEIPGTTKIQVTFTKYGTKKQKIITSKNYKIVLGDAGADFYTTVDLPEYVGESGNLKGIIRLKISNNSIKGKKSITKRLN